jgi:hypothetical protein
LPLFPSSSILARSREPGLKEPLLLVGHVTSFARLNLIGMGKNMFPLTLVLAGIVAASQAQGNSNHLSGQTSCI